MASRCASRVLCATRRESSSAVLEIQVSDLAAEARASGTRDVQEDDLSLLFHPQFFSRGTRNVDVRLGIHRSVAHSRPPKSSFRRNIVLPITIHLEATLNNLHSFFERITDRQPARRRFPLGFPLSFPFATFDLVLLFVLIVKSECETSYMNGEFAYCFRPIVTKSVDFAQLLLLFGFAFLGLQLRSFLRGGLSSFRQFFGFGEFRRLLRLDINFESANPSLRNGTRQGRSADSPSSSWICFCHHSHHPNHSNCYLSTMLFVCSISWLGKECRRGLHRPRRRRRRS